MLGWFFTCPCPAGLANWILIEWVFLFILSIVFCLFMPRIASSLWYSCLFLVGSMRQGWFPARPKFTGEYTKNITIIFLFHSCPLIPPLWARDHLFYVIHLFSSMGFQLPNWLLALLSSARIANCEDIELLIFFVLLFIPSQLSGQGICLFTIYQSVSVSF